MTGGARGIGRATALLVAKRDAAVCVNYTAHADAADELVAEIIAAGGAPLRLRRGRGDGRPCRKRAGFSDDPGE